jgi:hypothetical protein
MAEVPFPAQKAWSSPLGHNYAHRRSRWQVCLSRAWCWAARLGMSSRSASQGRRPRRDRLRCARTDTFLAKCYKRIARTPIASSTARASSSSACAREHNLAWSAVVPPRLGVPRCSQGDRAPRRAGGGHGPGRHACPGGPGLSPGPRPARPGDPRGPPAWPAWPATSPPWPATSPSSPRSSPAGTASSWTPGSPPSMPPA